MTPQQILLVSGPSGGGKSTFIRQLAAGTLAPEILVLMPAHAGNWPVIEANDVLKGNLSLESLTNGGISKTGVLLHYDIVFTHRYGLRRYEDDPACSLFGNADSLHVVFVRPDGALVRKQFLDRQTRHRKTKSKASLWWGRFVRHPLRRLFASFTGKPTLSTEDVYGDDKWLAGCYRQWEIYIHGLAERNPNASLSIVEPASASGDSEEFRLVGHTGIAKDPFSK